MILILLFCATYIIMDTKTKINAFVSFNFLWHEIAYKEAYSTVERDKITPLEKSIGEKIGKLRVNNGGETQEALAASIGVSREIIQHWERGTRHIKADHIKSLAQHFNVSSDYLLGLSDVSSNVSDVITTCNYTGLSEEAVGALYQWMGIPSGFNLDTALNSLLTNDKFWSALMDMSTLTREVSKLRLIIETSEQLFTQSSAPSPLSIKQLIEDISDEEIRAGYFHSEVIGQITASVDTFSGYKEVKEAAFNATIKLRKLFVAMASLSEPTGATNDNQLKEGFHASQE